MKAMIFAAGLGTRLHPITQSVPKALIKINHIPLIEIVIRRLILFGYNQIIINVHHHAEQIEEFIHENKNFGIDIYFSDERMYLLDTGGGLKKASWFFDDGKPFLVHNVDVISDVNLKDLSDAHIKSKALATLAVRNRMSSRYLLFNDQHFLCGWKNANTGEKIFARLSNEIREYAFSGIQMIDPEIFNLISLDGKFSIIDVYLNLASQHTIMFYEHNDSLWMDVGKPENLIKAEELICKIVK